MTKKNIKLNIKFSYDAPVTLTFSFFCVLIFLITTLLLKDKIPSLFFASPTIQGGENPVDLTKPLSYFQMIIYIFGSKSTSAFITNLIFILLLGPAMEEKYGSVVIGIMMIVSALFSGVLNACFCSSFLTGPTSIVFMLIFLNSFMSLSKKQIPLTFITVFVLFILREVFEKNQNGAVGLIICIAGGLCGSLFAFLTSPKARKSTGKASSGNSNLYDDESEADTKKKKGFGLFRRAEKIRNADENSSTSETIVGSIKFDD